MVDANELIVFVPEESPAVIAGEDTHTFKGSGSSVFA